MGFDLITTVYKKNESGQYEEMTLMNGTKQVYFPFSTKDHCFNQLMCGYCRSADYDFDSPFARRGLPDWYEGDFEEGSYVDVLELYAACGNPRFEYPDYNFWDESYENKSENELPKRKPISDFISVMDVWLEMFGIYSYHYLKPGDIIVVFGMSY